MYSVAKNAAVIACFLLPAFAHAQSAEPLTRAQVHARLIQLEKAGYNPYASDWLYPDSLKRAEANVAQQETLTNASYGSAESGTVQSGK